MRRVGCGHCYSVKADALVRPISGRPGELLVSVRPERAVHGRRCGSNPKVPWVREVSGASWRNVLLRRQRGDVLEEGIASLTRYAATEVELSAAYVALRTLAVSSDAPLSVLAVELIPAPLVIDGANLKRYRDPLRADLGQVRILRTSPLAPVPRAC